MESLKDPPILAYKTMQGKVVHEQKGSSQKRPSSLSNCDLEDMHSLGCVPWGHIYLFIMTVHCSLRPIDAEYLDFSLEIIHFPRLPSISTAQCP